MACCSEASSDAVLCRHLGTTFSNALWALSFACSRNVSSATAAAPSPNQIICAKLPELELGLLCCSKASSDAATLSSPRTTFSNALWVLDSRSRSASSETAAEPLPNQNIFAKLPEFELAVHH